MSVQFGRWNFNGEPAAPDCLEKVQPLLGLYGPDGGSSFSAGGVSISCGAFHTTKESRTETQPYVLKSGAVITWDGRLDNRAEFIDLMRDAPSIGAADGAIVAAAYQRWGTACFRQLIGDWALSIWDPRERSLVLAKDPVGTHHLYYSLDECHVSWSTILEPLVLFARKSFALDEEYIAGCLSFFPAAHLTPYAGIVSVPPSSFVRIRGGRQSVNRYWDFDPAKRIRYKSDREYEEHFRIVFGESVRRRLRSDRPVLAELSGGMDSSSIVCMADTLLARRVTDAQRLDTVSYYDDSEPNWDERPYFTKVEEQRGRVGLHIDVGSQNSPRTEFESNQCRILPASEGEPSEASKKLRAFLTANGYRVLVSGFGGDEVLGGVPNPTSELEDLLARGEVKTFAHQLKLWALDKRRPWFHMFLEVVCRFLPPALVGVPEHLRPAPWLDPDFVNRQRAALTGYESRLRLFGPLPTFQENLSTLEALRRQLACDVLPSEPTYEKRYPYLDRDLLEFLFALPREQLVRPGQRRSLMRRALVGVIPQELLNRKRKAFAARSPLLRIAEQSDGPLQMRDQMVMASLGMIDGAAFRAELEKARAGREISPIALLRTIGIEMWLRNLARCGVRNDERAPGEKLHIITKNAHFPPHHTVFQLKASLG
jgi:asparagine synthase (glutamine-hydrolysing)